MSAKHPMAQRLQDYAVRSFGPNGNLTGMRRFMGWQNAKPVKIGRYVYDAAGVYDKPGGTCVYDLAQP
jgi:hypothetical protein